MRDRLQLLEAEQVGGQRVAARARTRGGDRVGADGEHREVGRRLLVEVMGLDRVDDAGIDAEHPKQLAADDRVHPFDVVVDRLADVVEHAGLAGEALGQAQLGGEHAAEVAGLLAVQERVLPVREAVVQGAHQLGELGTALDLHLPERALADLDHPALGRAARPLDQRRDLGRLHAAVDDLERGLARDLASDRIDGPQRRLVLLGVDAELGAGLLGDHGERREHALPGVVVEPLERERRHPRCAVHVGGVLALDGLHDQVVGAGLDAIADDLGDGRLDERGALGDELGLDALQHQRRGGVAVERRLGAERLLDLRALLGDPGAPLLDLVAALAVGEAPFVEDLAALAEVLVALGDDRFPTLDRGEALLDLLHRRFVGVQRGGARLGDQCAGVLVGVGKALADQRRRRGVLAARAVR